MSQKLFLIGMPGSGKSTFGKELADKLCLPFVDLDEEIEKQHKPIPSIFSEDGEAIFREIEQKTLHQVAKTNQKLVISSGGGTPCFFDNLDFMKSQGLVIWLNTPVETIKERLKSDSSRPLLQDNSLEELYVNRVKFYQQANLVVNDSCILDFIQM